MKRIYYHNPFTESVIFAEYIKKHSHKNDKIAVLGSEPQIYFYSGMDSVTRHIVVHPLMENHPYALEMQLEMSREIEAAMPKYIVWVNIDFSWSISAHSNLYIRKWGWDYIKKHYHTVVVSNTLSAKSAELYWGSDAPVSVLSSEWMGLFKRNVTEKQ